MTPRPLSLLAIVAVVGLSTGGLTINMAAAQSDSASVPEVEWDTTLNFFQFDADKFVGQRFTAKCPPSTVNEAFSGVFGTDVYPSKSSICVAAVHAGQIDKAGGVVTVQLNPGEDGYTGSVRNGVETADLPGTPRSIVFVGPSLADAHAQIHRSYIPAIDWDTKFTRTGFAHKQLVGQRFTFNCPAAPSDLRSRRVIGTDSYAFSSMICRAAVHSGRITTDGGIVSLQMEPGDTKLVGSIRNGIETKDGPSGIRTISFVASSVQN